jgi:hypothetical protein
MIPKHLTQKACAACRQLCDAPRDEASIYPHPRLFLDYRSGSYAIYSCQDCGYSLVYNSMAERLWYWGAAAAPQEPDQ